MKPISEWTKGELADELLHFQEVASLALPRYDHLPKLSGIDYGIGIEPWKGCVGGDHVAIVNFEEYNLKDKIAEAREAGDAGLTATLEQNLDCFGILVADAAGHMITDSTTVNYLHGAFKIGIGYELKYHGQITPALFEMLNTRFYDRMRPDYLRSKPYLTLIYGEVYNDGRFRFLSAGHPLPLVFSYERDRIVALGADSIKTSTPLGIFPSAYNADVEHFDPTPITKDKYAVNEIRLLGKGDIMLLYTDGLTEHHSGDRNHNFRDAKLEHILRQAKNCSARQISEVIRREYFAFGPQEDDLALVVIKRQ
jgi:hypothetical protein